MKKFISTMIAFMAIALILFISLNRGNERLEPSYIQAKSCLANGLSDTTFVSIGEVANHAEKPVRNETILNFLHLNAWTETAAPQNKQKCKLVVHLGDEYNMYIYDNYAYVYDGYADFGKRIGAYYLIPQESIQDIDSFISNSLFCQ